MIIFAALAGTARIAGMYAFRRKENAHRSRMPKLDYNIYVNGIRGKSTITRMLGSVLREAGVSTVSKPRVPTRALSTRKRASTPFSAPAPRTSTSSTTSLKEWLDGSVNGLVVECMAVKPKYQNLCQNVILRSPISVMTNVRLDHQEEMGDTVEEIADSLCNTVPEHGLVITGERNESVLKVIQKNCEARSSRLIVAEESELSRSLVDKFAYQQFEENVAVVSTLAEELHIDTDVAVRGMLKAEPDPGTTKVIKLEEENNSLYWVPMFAVNDWESTTKVYSSVHDGRLPEGTKHVIAMNNRADRTDRASMFVDVITKDLKGQFDKIVLYGDIQDVMYQKLIAGGVPERNILTTTDIEETDGKALVARARESFDDDTEVAVYGMVNIHTQHVQSMEKYISTLKSENVLAPVEELTGSVEVAAPEEAVTTTNTDAAARGKDVADDAEVADVAADVAADASEDADVSAEVAAHDKDADIDTEIGAVSRKDEHVEVMA